VIDNNEIDEADNANARLFVRPHEIRVTSKPTGNQEVPVTVTHIHLAGPRVRLELEDDENKILQVDMSHDDFLKTQLKKNDKAFVSLQKSRIFISDED
jgi:sulfate/thiosulfate transport system ATP-binding protein